jgi:hypothetical protein
MKILTVHYSMANDEIKIEYSEGFIVQHWVTKADILGDLIAKLKAKYDLILIEQRKLDNEKLSQHNECL